MRTSMHVGLLAYLLAADSDRQEAANRGEQGRERAIFGGADRLEKSSREGAGCTKSPMIAK